jgi:hypothetical protein
VKIWIRGLGWSIFLFFTFIEQTHFECFITEDFSSLVKDIVTVESLFEEQEFNK